MAQIWAAAPLVWPTPPKGCPIGSYPTYAEAQRAVDYLSDQEFPVQQVTIVGVDLMQVERVTGRLSWPKVLGGGVLTGAWLALSPLADFRVLQPQPVGSTGHRPDRRCVLRPHHVRDPICDGTRHKRFQFYAATRGGTLFNVLCDPQNAERGRDLLARLTI